MKKRLLPFVLLPIFALTLLKTDKAKPPVKPITQGVILPHHALAKELFHKSFIKLKENTSPDRIVIYGTNHYFPTSETYTSTTEVINKYNLSSVLASNERINSEHSIQTLVPYLKEYFPKSEVIPIIVSSSYKSFEDLKEQSKQFTNRFGRENTLYIAAVDFAHNVTLEEGLNKNTESVKSISEFDYNAILKYSDDHLDSPLAITTLLLTMQELSAVKWETWDSSHGALITNTPDLNGTSYIIGVFTKEIDENNK